jgi:general stress protein YciG
MMTEQEIAEARSQAAALLGRKGGERRAEKLSAKRRREIARKAAAARWANRQPEPEPPTGTDSPRSKVVSIADAGRKGGKARAAKLTPEQRSESARKAVEARWSRVHAANPLCGAHHLGAWAVRSGSNDGASYRSAA